MRRLPHIITCLLLTLALFTACSDDTCQDNGSSLPLATCYVGNISMKVSGLTIKGIGVPGDSLLADSATLDEIYLPLRVSATTTSYAITRWAYRGEVLTCLHDTITFGYQPIEYFHSAECGAMYNFDIQSVDYTTHAIDSVVILTKLITNARTPSLRIHFADFNP